MSIYARHFPCPLQAQVRRASSRKQQLPPKQEERCSMSRTTTAVERLFRIRERGSSIQTELVAGLTTFVTMAYIIFVNPSIMADAGIPKEAAFVATIYATVLGNLLMGLWVNYPIALAPGMGLNAFFAYYVCGTVGLHWTVALGAVFISGVIFLILTLTRVRETLFNGVPMSIKYALVVGVGMFIALIGLKNAGIVAYSKATLVTLGDLSSPAPLLACFGMAVSSALLARRVPAAILIGIVATTLLSMCCGASPAPAGIENLVSLEIPSLAPVFMQLDIRGALHYGLASIVLTFTIVELFDNMGALIGLSRKAGFMEADGRVRGLGRALTTDSAGTIVSSFLGTSTITTYIESAAGIAQGGRTGLASITVAVLFALSLFFSPLIGLVPACATAPVLLLVGASMMTEVTNINFNDPTEGVPAFLTIIMMPMTCSVASGFGFGFISYVVIKTLAGRAGEIPSCTWIIAALFGINFFMRG